LDFIRNLLIRNACSLPEKAALVCGDAVVTHARLNSRVNRLANALRSREVRKGTVVGLFVRNSIEFVEILFACQKLGATATPANTRYQAKELGHQMAHARATVLFFDSDAADIVNALRSDGLPRAYVSVGDRGPSWATAMSALIQEADSEQEPPRVDLGPGDISTVLYTSGTTGVAKAVAVSYRGGLYIGILEANSDIGLTAGDISLCVAPLFHQGVYGMNLMMPLMVGGTVVIQRRFDADEALRNIEKYGVTYAFLVPTMSEAILKSPELHLRRTDSFRTMMSSGSLLPEKTRLQLHGAFPGIRVFENYGATETFNSLRLAPRDFLRKPTSAGVPVLTQQVRLLTKAGREAAVGEVGELLVRGPAVLTEYYRAPSGSAPALDAEGWFHTGDLAQQDADGFYSIVGRSSEMIISGGENIYPREIEEVIEALPSVIECAVVGLPDDYWGELVCAYVVRSDGNLSEGDVTEQCARLLAGYKRPRKVFFIERLPRNAAGKVVRGELRKMSVERSG
jgi:acyl-CoA synthetase (AMP-forming)/AMP-acid ligase II